MLHWVAAAAKIVWSPAAAANRRIRRHYVAREAFVREGSEVVTPIIEFAQSVGPIAATIGDQEQIQQRVTWWWNEWGPHRLRLLTYANRHPSEEVRSLADEVCDAVLAAISSAHYLSVRMDNAEVADLVEAATTKQDEAISLAKSLMEKIRRY